MGLVQLVKGLYRNVIPPSTRALGGTFITYAPHGAGLLGAASKKLTANNAATWAFGAVAVLEAAGAVDSWIEGLVINQASTAAKEWVIALTSATAITAAAQIEAEVPVYLGIATDEIHVKLDPPVRIPAGAAIGAAVAHAVKAANTVHVYAVISRNR